MIDLIGEGGPPPLSGPSDPVIVAENLSRRIEAPWGAVDALRDASLSVEAGRSVAIVGPSGSGKSTLLNLLGLLDTPTTGSLRIAGREVSALRERDRCRLRAEAIGFVFQSFHLIPHKSVLHNVALPLSYARRGGGSSGGSGHRLGRARAALDAVGLGHRMNSAPTTLSGGERQRAAVARALVRDPAVLLCDEPTGNLDAASSETVLSLLLDLAGERSSAVVLVTHDREVAARCDAILTMTDGVLRRAAGAPS